MVDINSVKRDVRKLLNLDPDNAVLGIQTGANVGQIYVPYKRGYVWVCEKQASGYSAAKAVRLGPNVNLEMKPGMGVKLGYIEGEQVVLWADFNAIVQSGGNPAQSNPLDPTRQYSGQQGIITARATPDNPDNTMNCIVKSWVFYQASTWFRFAGRGSANPVDLTSLVPAAGMQCLACVLVLADGSDVEVTSSMPVSSLSPIAPPYDLAYMQECTDAATAGSYPLIFWRLYGGQTELKASDEYMDARQFINVT